MSEMVFPCPHDPRAIATGPGAKSEYGPCPSVWLCEKRGCQRKPTQTFISDARDPLQPPYNITYQGGSVE